MHTPSLTERIDWMLTYTQLNKRIQRQTHLMRIIDKNAHDSNKIKSKTRHYTFPILSRSLSSSFSIYFITKKLIKETFSKHYLSHKHTQLQMQLRKCRSKQKTRGNYVFVFCTVMLFTHSVRTL